MPIAPKHPVPVFPLPGVVLFPHAPLALHVVELRYRNMVRDALAGERKFAMATLKPGWEADYYGSPEFHELGCVAQFEHVEWLPDDCYNLRIRGVERVLFTKVVNEFPYRSCEVEPLPFTPYDEDDPLVEMERDTLMEATRRLLPLGSEAWLQPPLSIGEIRFEAIVNMIAHSLRIPAEARLEMLAMDGVFDRSRRLLEHLRQMHAAKPAPPPDTGGRN